MSGAPWHWCRLAASDQVRTHGACACERRQQEIPTFLHGEGRPGLGSMSAITHLAKMYVHVFAHVDNMYLRMWGNDAAYEFGLVLRSRQKVL